MKIRLLTALISTFALALPLAAFAGPAGDSDSDGTFNVLDICQGLASAPGTCAKDQDVDGYGNACDCDYDNDGDCDGLDFNGFRNAFNNVAGTAGATGVEAVSEADHDCDNDVDGVDFNQFRNGFNDAPPGVWLNSGLSCAGQTGCE